MALVEVTEQEKIVLEAAREYGDALAVLRGKPPFSGWDAAKIEATKARLLIEALRLSDEREAGPSIPAGGPAPPDLAELMKRFLFPGERPKI
jgi:hypothetical protein